MILIISTCNEKLHELEFVKPIENIIKNNKLKYKSVNYKKLLKNEIDKADKIIITGTSLKDNDFIYKNNIKKFEFIKYFNKPILGICAGMHLIGLVYQGKLENIKQIGPIDIEFTDNFLGIEKNSKHQVYSLHGLCIDFTKINVFNVLSYVSCPQAIKHNSKEIYGVLFHPEVKNKKIIEYFLKFL